MNSKFLVVVDQMKTVSLPEIGAVVKMGKKYTFNHFLKFNDGRFSKYLQMEENLSKDEADAKVKEWTLGIIDQLNNNGTYVFDGIGTLYKEAENKYRWEQILAESNEPVKKSSNIVNVEEVAKVKKTKQDASSSVQLPEYEGGYLSNHFSVARAKDEIKRINDLNELIEFTKNDKRSTILTATEKQKKKIKAELVTKHDEEEKNLISDKSKEPDSNKIDVEVAEQVEKESKILETIKEKEAEENKSDNNEQGGPTKFNLDDDNADNVGREIESEQIEEIPVQEKQPVKKKKKLFLIAMLLIFSGTSLIGFLKYDKLKHFFLADNDSKKEKKDNIDADSKITDATANETIVSNVNDAPKEESFIEEIPDVIDEAPPEEEVIVEETPEVEEYVEVPAEAPINDQQEMNINEFNVVVGSYSNLSYAEKHMRNLIKDGYSSSVYKGKKDLNYVLLGSYESKAQAKKALEDSGMSGWIKQKL